jgi:ribose transport system permease protein
LRLACHAESIPHRQHHGDNYMALQGKTEVPASHAQDEDPAVVRSVPQRRQRIRDIASNQQVILLVVFIGMVLGFSSMNGRFFSTASFANIMQDWAPVMLLAVGETYIIISGGIDLSVGSCLGLSGIACALIMRSLNQDGVDPWLAILAGIGVGAAAGLAVGLVNGILITKAKLAPFIATLATMGAAFGLTLVLSEGQQIAGGPDDVVFIGNNVYLGMFTLPLMAVIVIVLIGWAYLGGSAFGRWTYAVGSNSFAARAAGINVEGHLVRLYLISGLLAGFAGVVVYFRLGSGSPTSGSGQELTAIAATVIGGTSLVGGVGSLSGTIIGAFIISSVLSGLILIGVEPNWQQVAVGALIAGAVIMQRFSGSARQDS